jgi:hypothetical protein
MSGIVTLTSGDEPLNDGDPFNCYFDYDASGNNTIDFGFFDPNFVSGSEDIIDSDHRLRMYPNPVQNELVIECELKQFQIEICDAIGQIHTRLRPTGSQVIVDLSAMPEGMYFIRVMGQNNVHLETHKIVKQ